MVDEQEPAKRVVKRVVKKTVVRPAPSAEPAPQIRYGRPVATAAKPQAKAQSRPGSKPAVTGRPAARAGRPRRNLAIGAKAATAGRRVADGWWAVADRAGDAGRTSGRFVAARARAVAAWRLPHINLYLAAVITGAVVGAVAVILGVAALSVFEAARGVSNGGGFWGGLTFVGVAVIATFLGESLLRGFGSRAARLTSFLAVVITVVAMLGLNLGQAESWVALVLVPVLGVAAHAVAHWLVDLAENAPAVVE